MSGARIFVTRRLPPPVEARMAQLFDVQLSADDAPLAPHALAQALEGYTVLVSAITDRLDADLIARLPQSVRLIAQFGNGVDNIDIDAAYTRGITVTNTPSVLTEDTADMAMMLMLALPRRLIEGAQVLLGDQQWAGWAPTWMLGRRLRGKALGIIGMGRIGTAVAQRARAFGLSIHYFSRSRRPPAIEEPLAAAFWHELDPMLEAVDIVTLHTPLTRDTFRILSKDRIRRLRPDTVVVNVARPELIDQSALITAIEENRLAGAALDVVEQSAGIDPRLLALVRANRVVLTPHMASATLEGRIEMGETFIVNIRTFLDGHQPPHRVLKT
jgi:glyoxylate reductase